MGSDLVIKIHQICMEYSSYDKTNMNVTYVTSLFDIPKRDGKKRRSMREYLDLASKFTLKLSGFMVIFTESSLYEPIWLLCQSMGRLDRTMIITLEFESLKFYHMRSDLQALLDNMPPYTNLNKEKDTVPYHILGWNKLDFVHKAINLTSGPLKTKYYSWIDFGIAHIVGELISDFDPTEIKPDKIRLLQMCHTTKVEVENMTRYLDGIRGKICSGFFIGKPDHLIEFSGLFDHFSRRAMESARFTNEEMIYSLVSVYRPDLFEFYYGDYSSLILNYNGRIVKDHGTLLINITHTNQLKDYTKCKKLCDVMHDSLRESDILGLAPEAFYIFIDIYFISSYYGYRESASNIPQYLLFYCTKFSQVRDLLPRHIEHIASNYRYLGDIGEKYIKDLKELCTATTVVGN